MVYLIKGPLTVGSCRKVILGVCNLGVAVYHDKTMFIDGSLFLVQQEKLRQAKQNATVQHRLSAGRRRGNLSDKRPDVTAACVLKTGLSQNICTVKTTVPVLCVCAGESEQERETTSLETR